MPAPVSPSSGSEHVRNIALDIVLTIFTCLLFNLYVQYRQMKAVNAMIKEEKYLFAPWLGLTIITCGLYHLYHEYRKSSDIARVVPGVNPNEPVIFILISLFGLSIIADAIQQTHINRYFGSSSL